MSYKSPLETRLAKKVTKAISEYTLIEDGDRVMVGLSGGKDSWALLNILDVLRKRAPISFSLVAVTVDSGYDGYRHDLIASTCEQRGWEYRIEHTEIGAVMDDLLDGATPCSLCARLLFVNFDEGTDTDVWALANNYISIVPVQFDMTHYTLKEKLEKNWRFDS